MELKFLIPILAILLVMSTSCAKDIDDLADDELLKLNYSDNITSVEINGVEFNIPKGYASIDDYNVNETEDGTTQVSNFYTNKNNDVIMISSLYGDDVDLNLDMYKLGSDYKKETINNHKGWEFQDNGYEFFVYIDNNNVIVLQAPDEDMFEDIIG